MSRSQCRRTRVAPHHSHSSKVKLTLRLLPLAIIIGLTGNAAQPGVDTLAAYDAYVESATAGLDAGLSSNNILWVDDVDTRIEKLRAGEIVSQPWGDDATVSIAGGEISDVIGAVFIPGKSLEEVLAVIQDYPAYQQRFAPEIVGSKLISKQGNQFKVAIKFVKKIVVSIGFNLEQDVDYVQVNEKQWQSRARAAKIAELTNVGTPTEAELSDDESHGYLWQMFSYENFEQVEGGVIVESRAITLSAALPLALSWMASTLAKIPQESMTSKLEAVRSALK